MKSWRLKIVAITWLQGGHHFAPQYRNTGLPSAFAAANAPSTSPLRQATPALSCACEAGVVAGAAVAGGVPAAEGLGVAAGSGDLEQAASTAATSRTTIRRIMVGRARSRTKV